LKFSAKSLAKANDTAAKSVKIPRANVLIIVFPRFSFMEVMPKVASCRPDEPIRPHNQNVQMRLKSDRQLPSFLGSRWKWVSSRATLAGLKHLARQVLGLPSTIVGK
jgi:hypothetical protein